MITYQDAVQEIISLYADYVEVCARNDESYVDYSEALVVAVEALLIKAEQDRIAAMHKEYMTQMSGVSTLTPFHGDAQQMIFDATDSSEVF